MSIKGRWTDVNLQDAASLFAASSLYTTNGPLPFSQSLAQLSLELAASSYDLQTEQWQAAGWMDFSFQADNKLLTGNKLNPSSDGTVHHKISRLFHKLAQNRLQRANPLSQLYGALRQKDKSDTCKSLIMIHPISDNQFLVAISFMGTGKRLYDWISNFRLQKQNNMHQGFLQLTEEFESHIDEIRFPRTAQMLGLDRLTLDMILDECTHPHSRFRIWMAGHSQGAAIMQIFTRRLIENGVMPQYLIGCGFASPTVTYSLAYHADPLHHLICSDDLTPRIGAKYHIGQCHVFTMSDSLRSQCYQTNTTEKAFMPLLLNVNQLGDTRQTLLFVIGFLRALSKLSDHDAQNVVRSLGAKAIPSVILDMLGDGITLVIARLMDQAVESYRDITGENGIPFTAVMVYEEYFRLHLQFMGAEQFAALLVRVLSLPHKLRDKKGGQSTYQRMVTDQFSLLRPMIHLPASWPVTIQPLHMPRRKMTTRRFAAWSAQRKR